MAVDLKGVFGGTFSGLGGKMGSMLTGALWGIGILLVIGVVAFLLYRSYKNKATYIYPITLTTLMENGMEKTRYDLRGGMFDNNGIKDFKVKSPGKYKTHTLGYVPDLGKSRFTDGRLNFITSGDRTAWQQYETKWVTKETIRDGEHVYEKELIAVPIARETKQATINSMRNWRETIEKNKLTAFGIAIGAFIIMVIAHLISLFIQTKIRCPTPV